MTLEEFEAQYRNAMDEILNQLQTTILLLAQAQSKTAEVGNSIQILSQTVEVFLSEQKEK